jgi:heme exporter protein D
MFFTLIPLLVYLAIIVLAIWIIVSLINFVKQRNEYLNDIRDELRKLNSNNKQ